MAKVKLSVTVDEEVAIAVRDLAGPGGTSAFVNEELANAVWRRRAGRFLDELTDDLGPPPGGVRSWATDQVAKAKAALGDP